MDEKLADPQESVVRAIGSAGGFDLLVDLGEVALDSALKEGLLREVPVVGSLVNL